MPDQQPPSQYAPPGSYPPLGHRPPPRPARHPLFGLALAPLVMIACVTLAGPVLTNFLLARTDDPDAWNVMMLGVLALGVGLVATLGGFVLAGVVGVVVLKLRWWWLPVSFGLGVVLLVLGALTRVLDGAQGLAFAAPYLAALTAPPVGTPREGLVIPAVLAVVAAVVGVLLARTVL
ncbi:hypothetical protein GCM10027418_07610 [Mariniluteicoccus endophyticus]